MCMQQRQFNYFFPQNRSRVRVLRLSRKKPRGEDTGTEMELENLKLYLENMSIVQENEKLRKQAHLLHQQNLALMAEFQKRFSMSDIVTAMTVNDRMLNAGESIKIASCYI